MIAAHENAFLASFFVSFSFVYDSCIVGTVNNSVIHTLLYMSPGIGFIMEVRNGTMSRETYPREEYSCCCTGLSRRSNALVEPIFDDVRDIH
jgi:hypothetical protein